MARPFHDLQINHFTFLVTTSPVFLLIAAFATSSTLMFLCTTRKHLRSPKHHQEIQIPSSDQKLVSNVSNISSKALLMEKMISWKKGEDDGDEAVWRKTIMMGERCRPLDFSGNIVYDSEGNRLPKLPTRLQHGSDSSVLVDSSSGKL